MSTAKSPFLEKSKHQGMSSMVEDHIMGGQHPDATGMSPAQVKGYNGTNSLPPPTEDYPFNSPDTGVNYVPRSRAGHKVGGR